MTARDQLLEDAQAFSQEAWVDVIQSIDQTYQELLDHQTALEERNRELEVMRHFLTSIIGAMSDVLIVCGPDGQVLEVNNAFEAQTGIGRKDALGRQAVSFFDDEARHGLAEDLQTLRNGGTVETTERALLIADGTAPLELSAAARRDERGRFRGMVLIGRPVGELRRAYREISESHDALKEAQSQLVHSEKLASLGRLVAGVAHELNNPISFVYGNAHALDRYVSKFEAYFNKVEAGASRSDLVELRHELKLDRAVKNLRSATSGALEGAERVRDIVENLRRLSAEGKGPLEPFDLTEVAKIATHWVIKGRGMKLEPEIAASGPVTAIGRAGHIQQVVMNLVQNALDAMESMAEPALDIRVGSGNGHAVLEVADRGPGVADNARANLFEPFFTTKPVGQGTGLGLSISYKIVEDNGGTLSFRNRKAGGAVFRLTLPQETGNA